MHPMPSWCRDLSSLCNAIAYNAIAYITFCLQPSLPSSCTILTCFLSRIFSFFVACLPLRVLPTLPCWGMHAQLWKCYQGLRHLVLETLFCLGIVWGSKACLSWSGENAISLLWRVLEELVVEGLWANGACSSAQGSRNSPSVLQTLC